jgi:hypothetical protein
VEVEATIQRIGPKEAEALLSTSARNRKLRLHSVKQMARAMAQGDWRKNGEAIKLDEAGRLLDGQHRLRAIILAGVTLDLLVIKGLDADAQEFMDMGSRRTMADLLILRKERNTHLLAATLGALFRIRTGSLRSLDPGDRPTHQELVALLECEPRIRDFLQGGRSVADRVGVSASLASALWYEFSRADAALADEFFGRLINGQGLEPGDPIFALRRFLERERHSARSLSRYRLAGMVIKAWNVWYQGGRIYNLAFRAGGVSAERFPEIHGLEDANRSASDPRAFIAQLSMREPDLPGENHLDRAHALASATTEG